MSSPEYEIHLGDCVPGMREKLPDESVDLIVTSIPFGALFMYSGKMDDIGNNRDGVDMLREQFAVHLGYSVAQMFRVIRPGCNACIHVQQLLRRKNQHGEMGMRDFRGAVIEIFESHGFIPYGEFAIPKNPQKVAQRSNLHSLMFQTAREDSRRLVPTMNDYVLVFRKADYADPEKRAAVRGMRDDRNPGGDFTPEEWIRWARGVWDDILEIDTLDGWKSARRDDEEKHVCPLQLEVIRRCVRMYTRPGQLVLDPFMGIGSTAYVAIEQGRRSVGFELHENYHRLAIRNCEKAVRERDEKERSGGLFARTPAEETA